MGGTEKLTIVANIRNRREHLAWTHEDSLLGREILGRGHPAIECCSARLTASQDSAFDSEDQSLYLRGRSGRV